MESRGQPRGRGCVCGGGAESRGAEPLEGGRRPPYPQPSFSCGKGPFSSSSPFLPAPKSGVARRSPISGRRQSHPPAFSPGTQPSRDQGARGPGGWPLPPCPWPAAAASTRAVPGSLSLCPLCCERSRVSFFLWLLPSSLPASPAHWLHPRPPPPPPPPPAVSSRFLPSSGGSRGFPWERSGGPTAFG